MPRTYLMTPNIRTLRIRHGKPTNCVRCDKFLENGESCTAVGNKAGKGRRNIYCRECATIIHLYVPEADA